MSRTAPASPHRRSAVGRRRGAPRSRLVRRFLASALAVTAVLLALRDRPAPAPDQAGDHLAATEISTIPLVLAVDAATASVLQPGRPVDLYAATGEQPPVLTASGLPLLDVRRPSGDGPDVTARPAYVVVGVTPGDTQLIGSLLAAEAIVATVSAVHP